MAIGKNAPVADDITRAEEALLRASQTLAALETRLDGYRAIVSPVVDRPYSVDPLARLEAEASYGAVSVEVLHAKAAVLAATRTRDALQDARRARIAEQFDQQLAPALQALASALKQAKVKSDTVAALQLANHEQTGRPIDALSWPELTRYDHWLGSLKTYGFDVE